MFLELRCPKLSTDMVRNNFHGSGLTSRHFLQSCYNIEHQFLGFFMWKMAPFKSFMYDPEVQESISL